MTDAAEFEIIIGLEVHVQLQTQSKLFCRCSTEFGAPPNTQTCHVCTGMPGALPVLNGKALELAIKTGLALNCQIERNTKWDRKNYFYPDLPKGYQISQFDRPICYGGYVKLVDAKGGPTNKEVRIERAHLEEDAGKSNHDESGRGGNSKIDLNRAGTPLLEIVTKPDLRAAADAKNFLSELKLILTYIDVSDCNMQQGSLRVDANINLWIGPDRIATPIVEVKNLNSFRAVERAIQFEAERQLKLFHQNGDTIETSPRQTRGWDDVRQETVLQREKEDSADYRYFPDPDLVSIQTTENTIASLRKQIGSLPQQQRQRLLDLKLSQHDADILTRQGRAVIDFFDQVNDVVQHPKLSANWILQEVLRFLNENESSMVDYPVTIEQFCELLVDVRDKGIDQNRGKEALRLMVSRQISYFESKKVLGIETVDEDELESLCNDIISNNPAAVADIKSGNGKAIGTLIGQAKKMNRNANPGMVRSILLRLIEDA